MSDQGQVYRKVGRRYIPIGPLESNWFPADGIWLVQIKPGRTSQECVLRLGELPDLYPYVQLAMDRDEIVDIIARHTEKTWCIQGLATEIIKWLHGKIKLNKPRGKNDPIIRRNEHKQPILPGIDGS